VVTLACDVQMAENKLRVKRILKDGFEVLEAPMPSLVTVSSEIGLPRLPAGMRLMLARKKQIPVWNAQDLGAESSQLDRNSAHTEVTGLTVPTRKTECEIIGGNTPGEAAASLAMKLIERV
jgi:electron transfer flavoprotein beta subunit